MLDPQGRREVLSVMEKLNREQGITVIWITHFMEEAVRFSRLLVMDRGRVVMDGTPAEVFSDEEKLERMHLRLPVMARLSMKLRKENGDIPLCLTAEDLAREAEKRWN